MYVSLSVNQLNLIVLGKTVSAKAWKNMTILFGKSIALHYMLNMQETHSKNLALSYGFLRVEFKDTS